MAKFKIGDSIVPNDNYYDKGRRWTTTVNSLYDGGVIKVLDIGAGSYLLTGTINGYLKTWHTNVFAIEKCFDLKKGLTLKRKEYVKTRPRASTTKEQ